MAALDDAAFAVCVPYGLLRVDRDGSIHTWLAAFPGARPLWGEVADVAHTADNGVLAVTDSGLWRAGPGKPPAQIAGALAAGVGVDVLPDGSAVVADGKSQVLRVGPDGSVVALAGTLVPGFSGDGGPALDARLDRPCDVAVARDALLIAECGEHGRIRRVAADRSIATVAGSGRRWQERAAATAVQLRAVTAVDALPDGTILIADGRLLAVGTDGRIRTVLRDDDTAAVRAVNAARPAAVAVDGALVTRAAARVNELDALPDGTVIAAGSLDDSRFMEGRVMLLASTTSERLAVALPARDRILMLQGRIDVRSTLPATGRLEIRRGRKAIAAYRVKLRAGVTRVRIRTPHGEALESIHVTAHSADGAVAEHRLTVVPSGVLDGPTARRVLRNFGLDQFGDSTATYRHCRRVEPRRWRCDETEHDDVGIDVGEGVTSVILRADGLLAIVEHPDGAKPLAPFIVEPR